MSYTVNFSSGVQVTVAEATGRKKAGVTRVACPHCQAENDLTATGGDLPPDFKFNCQASCGYTEAIPVSA